MNNRQTTFEVVQRINNILYRPLSIYNDFDVYVYKYEKQKLDEKEREVSKLIQEIKEDREEIEDKHRKHMEDMQRTKEPNPLQ